MCFGSDDFDRKMLEAISMGEEGKSAEINGDRQ